MRDIGAWRIQRETFALEVLKGTTAKVLGSNTVSRYIFCKVRNPTFGWYVLYMTCTVLSIAYIVQYISELVRRRTFPVLPVVMMRVKLWELTS